MQQMQSPGQAQRLLSRLVDVRPRELATLLWAFIYFYCVLCSYYIIRPIRDTMGISAGVDNLQLSLLKIQSCRFLLILCHHHHAAILL
jgi:ATP/ADP translocase